MGKKHNRKPRIAILTGGGDVPGLNPCIKTPVCRADSEGIDVIGVRRGWTGLLEYNPDAPDDSDINFHCLQELTPKQVRTTDIPLSTVMAGQKRVDVRELYDEQEYRPKVRHAGGKPMFLY